MRAAECNSGFTLIEIMIALAVLSILGTLAIPGFTNLLQDSSRTSAVNAFIHTVFLARSEALKRGEMVSICKSPDGANCNTAGEWNGGWITFVNSDRDEPPQRDADESLLQVQEPWRGGKITANRAAFSFRPHTQGVVNGTIVFCDRRGSAAARAVIISHVGRPRVSPRDASNHSLVCAST
jgi:type IV fimbrial biogenesis protein FimT